MKLFDLFKKVTPLPEGMHHLQSESANHKPYRVHLRLRKDGSGIFIVNVEPDLQILILGEFDPELGGTASLPV